MVTLTIEVPEEVVCGHRPPSTTSTYTSVVPVPCFSKAHLVGLKYTAFLFECAEGHRFRHYLSTGETRPLYLTCGLCGSDAEPLTYRYRWVPTGDGDYCHGCGAGWDRVAQRATHKDRCPYEEIGCTD
jgi:hypothetical protein